MAIGRNILSALGGLLNRRPDEEDPLAGLSPEALAGYYGAQAQNQANNRQRTSYKPYEYAPSNARIEGDLKLSPGGVERASERSRQKGMRQLEQFDAKVADQRALDEQRREDERAAREAQETAQRNIDRRRSIREGVEDARNKAKISQEKRMSRQNLRDAESGARSDFQDKESKDRILEGIMRGTSKAQETAQRNIDRQKRIEQGVVDARNKARRTQDLIMSRANERNYVSPAEKRRLADRESDVAEQQALALMEEIGQTQTRQPTDEEVRLDQEIADKQTEIDEVQQQIDNPGMFGDRNTSKDPFMMEETKVTKTAPEKGDGFLSRLGRNPELLAQIAQLGGGLISGMAQDKAQRRADATTQDRMARANLIGALTGRTPGVAEERADTGGFFSLDTLGKAIKGGGALAQDEIQRGEAREQQEIENRIAMAKATGKGSGGAAGRRTVAEMDASLAVVDDSLSQLEKFFEQGGGEGADSLQQINMIFQGLATRLPMLGVIVNPEKQTFTDMRGQLVGEIARMIAGGRTSDLETRMAEEIVPDIRNPRDAGKFGVDKMRHLKRILTMRRDAMAQGLDDKNLYEDLYAIFGKGYKLPEPRRQDEEPEDRPLTKEELEEKMAATKEEMDTVRGEMEGLVGKMESNRVMEYLNRQPASTWAMIEAAQANPDGPEFQELMKDPTIAKFLVPGA